MRLVPYALLRAPLLPVSALDDARVTSPLFEPAVALASPTLHEHADDRATERLARYRRRAAFRSTPHGLLAGVAVVPLDARVTKVMLGEPRGVVEPTWARLASMGRELLQGAGWLRARLRIAPSLLVAGERASFLAFGEHEAVRKELDLDATLHRIMELAQGWTAAPALAKKLGRDAQALLLQLVDEGFLHHDLEPPLVGPRPLEWMASRADLGRLARALDGPVTLAQLDEAKAALQALPGDGPLFHATLVHEVGASHVRAAPIERAASLAPLLFALTNALSPPIDEGRLAGVDEAFAAASALVGEGLLTVAALDHELYGARRADEPQNARLDVVVWLAGLVAGATGAEIVLDAAELARRCGLLRTDTFELQLAPCTGTSEGEGWLLGLHAPAGSSWGRFAHALGDDLAEALVALNEAERELDGDVVRLDVAYAPNRDVADLCCVPALRDAALAISSWPDEGAVTPQQCQLVNEPAGRTHGAVAVDGQRLRIAPLHRVRSMLVAPGATRALLGDALRRQHAPWALTWGPLAGLPWLPRVRLEGFVVAPQSWALPTERDDASLAAWRAQNRVDRLVQIGSEDVLLPIDLDRAEQRAQLRDPAIQRVHEIWPPIGRELDEGGRRIELVCAVLDEAVAPLSSSLRVASPPSEAPADPGWRTVVLFSARRHHAALLAVIAPFAAKRADGWFALPYVDDDGEQLRVRLHGKDPARLAEQLLRLLDPLVEAGQLVSTQVRPYHPERARYGRALPAVERMFQADSMLLGATLDASSPPEVWLAVVFEATVRGLSMPPATVDERIAALLSAYEPDENALAPSYRAVQRELAELLASPPPWVPVHVANVRLAKLGKADAAQLLPTLLHLSAVRHLGPDRDAEVRALYLWTRARRSRAARAR